MAEQDARGALALAREQGEARGQEQTFRRNGRELCDALGIGWSDERQSTIDSFSLEELQGLWENLLRQRRWP